MLWKQGSFSTSAQTPIKNYETGEKNCITVSIRILLLWVKKKKKKQRKKERKKTNDVLCKGREVGGNIENVGNNPCWLLCQRNNSH